jgi:hypothetical protein
MGCGNSSAVRRVASRGPLPPCLRDSVAFCCGLSVGLLLLVAGGGSRSRRRHAIRAA